MNKKILIVEDEEALRTLLSNVLQKHDFTVITAENGKIGEELALKEHPDLILLDLLMPVMNGMEALKILRKDAWGKNVPVIILTNLNATDEALVKDMVTEHPAYYLIKSDWKMEDVIKKINEVLK